MTAISCGPGWGRSLYKLVTILIKNPCSGYYLRWYYNGWHYWFFLPGKEIFQTEGEKYVTLGTRKVTMGSGQITAGQCAAIRTIMNSREVEIFTDSGWGNIRIEPGTLIVYDNKINGYEIELTAILGSKTVSVESGYTPIENIPVVEPPPLGLCECVIGTQVWMCKNYDTDFPGSKVWYNDESYRATWGGLYTEAQVNTPGFCPPGWHVPSKAEWEQLITFVGGSLLAGGKLKESGITHWTFPNTVSLPVSCFAALPGGECSGSGVFNFLGLRGFFRTSTIYHHSRSWFVKMNYDDEQAEVIYETGPSAEDDSYYLPVRLIKDAPYTPVSASDYFLGSKDEVLAQYVELYLHGMGGFAGVYWSSSQAAGGLDFGYAQALSFTAGVWQNTAKGGFSLARPIRSFAGAVGEYNLRDTGPAGGLIFAYSGGLYFESSLVDLPLHVWSNIANYAVTGLGTAIGTGIANTAAIIAQYVDYGLLYNCYAATYNTGGASIAPAGWHMPTQSEWSALEAYLGGWSTAGGKLKETGIVHWLNPNIGATNETGFTALPGGFRGEYSGATFSNIGAACYFYASDEYNSTHGYVRDIFNYLGQLSYQDVAKTCGCSIRLIKDDSTDPGTVTDIDGNVYPTVKIGTQVWMASNLKVTKYNDGTPIPEVTNAAAWAALITGARCMYNNLVHTDSAAKECDDYVS